MDPEDLKAAIINAVPWVKMSGISIDLFKKGRVKLSVPAVNHLNHVGIMYAGTHFMLMEVAGAALFLATYGAERFLPINKGMSIRFLKPALSGISCELRMDAEDALKRLQPIEEKGKGEWILDMAVTNADGITVSSSTCTYFIIPTGIK